MVKNYYRGNLLFDRHCDAEAHAAEYITWGKTTGLHSAGFAVIIGKTTATEYLAF